MLKIDIRNFKNDNAPFTFRLCSIESDANCDVVVDWGDNSPIEHIIDVNNLVHLYSGARESYSITLNGEVNTLTFNDDVGKNKHYARYIVGFDGVLPNLQEKAFRNLCKGMSNLEYIKDPAFFSLNRDKTSLYQTFSDCYKYKPNFALLQELPNLQQCYKTYYNCMMIDEVKDVFTSVNDKVTDIQYMFGGCGRNLLVADDVFEPLVNLRDADGVFYSNYNLQRTGIVFKTHKYLRSCKYAYQFCMKLKGVNPNYLAYFANPNVDSTDIFKDTNVKIHMFR